MKWFWGEKVLHTGSLYGMVLLRAGESTKPRGTLGIHAHVCVDTHVQVWINVLALVWELLRSHPPFPETRPHTSNQGLLIDSGNRVGQDTPESSCCCSPAQGLRRCATMPGFFFHMGSGLNPGSHVSNRSIYQLSYLSLQPGGTSLVEARGDSKQGEKRSDLQVKSHWELKSLSWREFHNAGWWWCFSDLGHMKVMMSQLHSMHAIYSVLHLN